jgi:outer membrane protein assembly factor BamB
LFDEEHCQADWARGACRYGVMPANGLLYVPPNPCFCYPGVKVPGFNAFSGKSSAEGADAGQDSSAASRLQRGPAYAAISGPPSELDDADAWPTYRYDARRSGATRCDVPAQVITGWQVQLRGPITPPVAAAGRVLVAARDEQTIYAFGADDGRELWHFVASGRVDSPPTILGERVLFGCANGCVYCLRASDGALAWRFRAAPIDRRIIAFDQLESVWRVHGSVLVKDGLVYCTAGRSTYLDGGIFIFALDPETGHVVHEARLDTWSRTREDAEGQPFIPAYYMEGARSDILVSEGDFLYLGQYKFDKALVQQDVPYIIGDPDNPVTAMDITGTPFTASDPDMEKGDLQKREFHRYVERTHPELLKTYQEEYGEGNLGDRQIGLHLMTTGGFLDDSWFNRTFWTYSPMWPGWYHGHRGAKSGQLLVMGPDLTYAVQTYTTRNRQSPLFTPGGKGYLLLADKNEANPVLDDRTRGATKGIGWTRQEPPVWHHWLPIRIRAMVAAGDVLFVAGPPDVVDADDPMASFEGRKGSVLQAVSASAGSVLAKQQLDVAPAFDGLIAAEGRLYMATTEGRLVCLRGSTSP